MRLLWDIYRETGYLAFVQALPDGAARSANLILLHDLARQFERNRGWNVFCITSSGSANKNKTLAG
ncbi:MAG: hypothetical protein RMJ82_14975 [Gemmatales bacterium]|nr:hypothetical protein [Gemmatales bacterium]